MSFIGASINRKFAGISLLNVEGTFLNRTNVLFITHSSLAKYDSNLDSLFLWNLDEVDFICLKSYKKWCELAFSAFVWNEVGVDY